MSSETATPSAPNTVQRFASVRSVIEQAIRQHVFPGAAWGVLHRGTIAALDATGRFTYEADAPVVQPQTIFDLASVTKVVATTSAAMLLVDRGILDLDSRVGDILPGFVIGMEPGSGKQNVTLRMLLAHTSGLPAYATLFREHSAPGALLRAILRLPLEAKPGVRTEYSDFGFILLGKAIEILSREPLDIFCAGEIFAPLRLETTRFCPPQKTRPEIPPTEDDSTFRHRIIDRVADLPRGLGAHDFGLKDLFAAAAFVGRQPDLHLCTIAVETVHPMCTTLTPAVAAAVPGTVSWVRHLAMGLTRE